VSDETIFQLVTFKIENEEFGINILKVQEINRMMNITNIPKTSEFVKGVINLRGKIIPVLDLRRKLGFPEKPYDKSTKIIVVECNGFIMGFIVDSVSEVLRLPKSTVERPPEAIVSGISSEFIEGIGKFNEKIFVLLNLDKLFSGGETLEKQSIEDYS